MRIPLMKNAFLREEETRRALAAFVMKAPRFSMGKECAEFEEQFARYQGCTYATLFNSGGSANIALLQALKSLGRLKEGDRVGFSALTWSTNVMPIIQMGFTPVPVDVDCATINVMADNLRATMDKTPLQCFFATNVLGFCGDLDAIRDLCNERGVILIEDNCESLGVKMKGQRAGNFGVGSTFSFFVAHHMSTIEGGMLCTSDEELHDAVLIARANGWSRNLSAETQEQLHAKYGLSALQAKYSFFDLGFNMRPTEITGFLGKYQMQFLDENIAIRNANHRKFEEAMLTNDELLPIHHEHEEQISPFGLVILCKTPALREKYIRRFEQAEIEIRPVIAGNMQNQPFYAKYVGTKYDLPNTDFIHTNGFYCGNYPELTESDVNEICSLLRK